MVRKWLPKEEMLLGGFYLNSSILGIERLKGMNHDLQKIILPPEIDYYADSLQYQYKWPERCLGTRPVPPSSADSSAQPVLVGWGRQRTASDLGFATLFHEVSTPESSDPGMF